MLEETALQIEETWANLVSRGEDRDGEQGTECSSSLSKLYM